MADELSPYSPVLGDEIARLIQKRGFSREALSKKSGVSTRTITRALDSNQLRLTNIKELAHALGVEPKQLIPREFQLPDPEATTSSGNPMPPGTTMTISIQVTRDVFDAHTTFEEWLGQLAVIAPLTGGIFVNLETRGGVQVKLKLTSEADVRALARAFASGALSPLAVDRINFDNPPFDTTNDVAQAVARLQRGALSNPASVAAEIQKFPIMNLVWGLFRLGSGPFAPGAPNLTSFKFDSGRELEIQYNRSAKTITYMSAVIPANELDAARARIAAWANLE